MVQKTTLMGFLLLMSSILLIVITDSCKDEPSDNRYYATFYFINASSEIIVFSKCDFAEYIPVGDTLVADYEQVYEGGSPDVNNFEPIPGSICNAIYGNSLKCEQGIYFIENYENKKQLNERNFEFTFRFTDEKMVNAEDCN